MKRIAALLSFTTLLLAGCGEPQRAIARHIVCDGITLGTTVVPEDGWGYGPYVLDGGVRMQYYDIDTGLPAVVDISHCKRVDIREVVVGHWKDYDR